MAPMRTPDFQKATARPAISLSGARASYVGPGLDLAPHRNAVATIALALQTPFRLAFPEDDGAAATTDAALIRPGVLHHLRASGDMAFIYLDALSDDFLRMETADLARGRARIVADLNDARAVCDVDVLCAALGVPYRAMNDPRIAGVVRQIDVRPQDFASVDDAARLAGVSTSRFQTLFRQSIGLSFRRYRLWRRMAAVIAALSAGRSLTVASLDAGFSGSAHLSATFKDMFGLTPSSMTTLGMEFRIKEQRHDLKQA
jgi:AraC-like DNA-binding protein